MSRGRAALGVALVMALGGCQKLASLASHGDAGDAGKADAFVCKAPPACPEGATPPRGAALAREVRARLARGAFEEAATLVACARRNGEEVTLEAEPGFETARFSPDGARLVATIDPSSMVRVFDTKLGEETMRIGPRGALRPTEESFAALAAGIALTPSSHLWDLDAETEIKLPGVITGTVRASKQGHWLWANGDHELLLARAEDVKKDGFANAIHLATKAHAFVEELPGHRLAISDGTRWQIIDESGATLASVPFARELEVVLESGLVFGETSSFAYRIDDVERGPRTAPLYVAYGEKPPYRHLSAPTCPYSTALAGSPDGTLVVTGMLDGFCIFDLPSKKLLGTVSGSSRWRAYSSRAAFAGNGLVVVEHGALLRIDRDAKPAVQELAPSGSNHGTILRRDAYTRELGGPRVIVGASEGQRSGTVTTSSDGGRAMRDVELDIYDDRGAMGATTGLIGGFVIGDPPLLVGAGGNLTRAMSCDPLSQRPCTKLPFDGAMVASPDGHLVAGPVGARPHLGSDSFAGHESLGIVDPATGSGRHFDAPGIDAVTFTPSGELEVLGEDGALIACELPKGPCRVRAHLTPGSLVLPSEAGVIVTLTKDEPALRVDGEPKIVLAPAKVPSVESRYQRWRPRHDSVVHGGRSLWIEASNRKLGVEPLGTSDVLRILADTPCQVAVDGAGRAAACLTNASLTVYAVDSGTVLYEEKFDAKPYASLDDVRGAVALSPDGAYLAYANDTGFAIIELVTKHVVARQDLIVRAAPTAIAVSDGGVAAGVVLPADDLRVASFIMLQRTAPGPLVPIPLLETGIHDEMTASLAASRDGHLALRWGDGNAILISPDHRVASITRASIDEGLWITRAGRTVPLGVVRAASTAVACRIGASIFPARACLPSTCDSSL